MGSDFPFRRPMLKPELFATQHGPSPRERPIRMEVKQRYAGHSTLCLKSDREFTVPENARSEELLIADNPKNF